MQQVMLSVKVVELTETGSKNIGMSWTVNSGNPLNWYEVGNNSGYDVNSGATPNTITSVPIGYFVRDAFILNSAISLQISQSQATVMATPRVIAQSGKPATIHVGDRSQSYTMIREQAPIR